ncbi:hypothetical protein AM2010_884 [Pelagerythrobacter marensis]|uniref:Uncharacterized protein n=2 Tax=Pelagerythrobacter marensis TaxID=543877 RepID=A0A0G3X6Z3_9SPHN|nr:hypothetical protein AM2010_884 [Pelagerythrobacter marensis]
MLVTVAAFALAVVGVQNASAPTATPTRATSAPAVPGDGVSRGAAPLNPYLSRFAAEARNSDWAAPAELRALALFTLVDGVRSVEVNCAATLCRVEGAVQLGAMKRAMAGVQGDMLRSRLAGAGLEVAAADFRVVPDAAEAGGFTAFLRRTD